MQLRELKEQIVKKRINKFYLFTGEEVAIMDIYIQKIAASSGLNLKRVESLAAIFSKLQNNSILSKSSCFVIRDDKDFLVQENIWPGITSGVTQGDNIIILVYTRLDKRGKFYKQCSDSIVEFEKLAPEVLAKYIQKEIGLPPKQGEELAEVCDFDYSRILLECDKLKHFSTARKCSISDAYSAAISEKIIHTSPKDVIFDFVDAICKRNVGKVYLLMKDLLAIGESPLAVISVLYNNMRAMLLLRGAGEAPNISDRTGLTPFQVKLAKEKGNNYSIEELTRAIRIIRETERGIKIGKIDAESSIDYILCNVL